MTSYTTLRSRWPLLRRTLRTLSLVAIAFAATSCEVEEILSVQDPDIVNPEKDGLD